MFGRTRTPRWRVLGEKAQRIGHKAQEPSFTLNHAQFVELYTRLCCLCRAIDSAGAAIDSPLSALRDADSAKRLSDPGKRFWEFLTANIRNRNTRRAYFVAASQFPAWCEKRRLALEAIQPIHVAAYIEHLMTTHAKLP